MGRRMRYDLGAERDLVRKKGFEHYGDEFERFDGPFGWERQRYPSQRQKDALGALRVYDGNNQGMRSLARLQRRENRYKQWLPDAEQTEYILTATSSGW